MGNICLRGVAAFGLVFVFSQFCPGGQAVTLDELAARCEAMELAVVDVSLEYDWYNIPPLTREDADSEGFLLPEDGRMHIKLSAANLENGGRRHWGLLMEKQAVYFDREGNRIENIARELQAGGIFKRFNFDANGRGAEGFIGARDANTSPSLFMTPLDFSVLRLANDIDGVPLSVRLKDTRIARFTGEAGKINGWDVVRADLLQEYTRQPCIAIYFSLQHNYTPVKYEYFNSGTAGTKLAFSVEVTSLDAVADGLWFPSSGMIHHSEGTRADAFQATTKLLVNRGLTAKNLDIDFPPGTRIYNRITGSEYVEGSSAKEK